MATKITKSQVRAGGQSDTAYTLENDSSKLTVWPAFGFNALEWKIRKDDGSWGDIFYTAADWHQNPLPTRSGHPILFPFPNRLEHGKMRFGNQEFQLPLTESTRTHSIHGFTPRAPWRILGSSMNATNAVSLTGRFEISQLPDSEKLWPARGVIDLTYTLSGTELNIETTVHNFHSTQRLPYGLGYHAYFRHPYMAVDSKIDDCTFHCISKKFWECDGNIPTKSVIDTPSELDFEVERQLNATEFDTLLSKLNENYVNNDQGIAYSEISTLKHPNFPGAVKVFADKSFPFLVLFTPAHRRAIAIEPYTCATNASNLPDSIQPGWLFLSPGMKNQHLVKYSWQAT